jgi:hypothetical protein
LITGAIFCDTRPATIIKSACRGDGRKTSAPNRDTSNRAAAIDIISIAQHANPNPSGQIELFRAQFTALSSVVKIIPSSSSSFPKSSGLLSVTCFPSDVLMDASSNPFSHTPNLETNPFPSWKSLLTSYPPGRFEVCEWETQRGDAVVVAAVGKWESRVVGGIPKPAGCAGAFSTAVWRDAPNRIVASWLLPPVISIWCVK